MLIFMRIFLPARLARITLTVMLSALSAGLFAQQGDTRDAESTSTVGMTADTAIESPVAAPAMSSAIVDGEETESENKLVTQTGNTVMTAGTCIVIDGFLRQFCSANPGDISCQFQ